MKFLETALPQNVYDRLTDKEKLYLNNLAILCFMLGWIGGLALGLL